MTIDLDDLKAKALAATSGPWTQDAHYVVGLVPDGRPGGEVIIDCRPTVDRLMSRRQMILNNAAYVTAANPQAVLALIAEVERLRVERDHWKTLAEKEMGSTLEMSEKAWARVQSAYNKEPDGG